MPVMALIMTMARMVAMKTKDKDNGDNEHDAATKTDMHGGVDEDNYEDDNEDGDGDDEDNTHE